MPGILPLLLCLEFFFSYAWNPPPPMSGILLLLSLESFSSYAWNPPPMPGILLLLCLEFFSSYAWNPTRHEAIGMNIMSERT